MVKRLQLADTDAARGQVWALLQKEKVVEAVVLERDGQPVAVVIGPDQWEAYERLARDAFFAAVDRIQALNAGVDPEEVEREVAAAIKEVRAEQRNHGQP